MLVKDSFAFRLNNTVLFLGAHDHPLQIFEGNFVVLRGEKGFVLAAEATVQVKDPPIHIDADHILVEQRAIKDNEAEHDKNR